MLEEFGNVIAPGGAAVVVASQSGDRLAGLTSEQHAALAMTPAARFGWWALLGLNQ